MQSRRQKTTLPAMRVNSRGKLQIGTYISHKIPTGLSAESAIKIEESGDDSDGIVEGPPPLQESRDIQISKSQCNSDLDLHFEERQAQVASLSATPESEEVDCSLQLLYKDPERGQKTLTERFTDKIERIDGSRKIHNCKELESPDTNRNQYRSNQGKQQRVEASQERLDEDQPQGEDEQLINYLVNLDENQERLGLSQRIEKGHMERQRILGSTKLGFYDENDEDHEDDAIYQGEEQLKGDFMFDLDSDEQEQMDVNGNESYEWGAGTSFPWDGEVKRINQESFHHRKFKKNQLQIINATKSGRDVIGLIPTGGGKSLTFQLTALTEEGVTVVIYPLLSLIEDQKLFMKKLGIEVIDGREINKIQLQQILRGEHRAKLIFATPERISKSEFFSYALQQLYNGGKLSHFVIDEAHCLIQWGKSFREDYLQLVQLREGFPRVPILALSATVSKQHQEELIKMLGLKRPVIFRNSLNRPNIDMAVREKPRGDFYHNLALYIKEHYPSQTGIIYCPSRKECEKTALLLRRNYALSCDHYHAGMLDRERKRVQRDWMEGRTKVMVATIAFGLGINKPNVRFVVHCGFPSTIEGYLQEIGRAGRDGKPSQAMLFYTITDRRVFDYHFPKEFQADLHKRMLALAKVIDFLEEPHLCRRQLALEAMGQEFDPKQCNKMCSNCRNPNEYSICDINDEAKAALFIVQAQEGKLTILQLVDLMLGKNKKGYRPKTVPDITITAIKSKGHLYARRVVLKLILAEVLQERYFPGTFGAQQAPISYLESKRFKAKDLIEGKLKILMSVSDYLLRRAAEATKESATNSKSNNAFSQNSVGPRHQEVNNDQQTMQEFLLPQMKMQSIRPSQKKSQVTSQSVQPEQVIDLDNYFSIEESRLIPLHFQDKKEEGQRSTPSSDSGFQFIQSKKPVSVQPPTPVDQAITIEQRKNNEQEKSRSYLKPRKVKRNVTSGQDKFTKREREEEKDDREIKVKTRKEDILMALRECREDIKLLAYNDKFAYLSIIDDTLSDQYLRKITDHAYELLLQNCDTLLKDSTDLKRMLEKKRMPDLSIIDCYGSKIIDTLRPFFMIEPTQKKQKLTKGIDISDLPPEMQEEVQRDLSLLVQAQQNYDTSKHIPQPKCKHYNRRLPGVSHLDFSEMRREAQNQLVNKELEREVYNNYRQDEITPSQEFFHDARGVRHQIIQEDSQQSGVQFLGEGDEGFKKMISVGHMERERSRDEERMPKLPRARKTKKHSEFL